MFAMPFLVFMLLMVVVPLCLLFFHAFAEDGAFTFAHFETVFTSDWLLPVLWQSIWIALVACVIILVIAYPIAYGLAFGGFHRKTTILLLFTLPLWVNLLIRSTALRQLFVLMGADRGMFQLLFAITINFLTIAILPIYIVLSNINKSHIEASQDLGASPRRVFFKTIFPQSIPGLIAAFVLVFAPVVSSFFFVQDFAVQGGTESLGELFGRLLRYRMFGLGAVISLVLLAFVSLVVFALNFFARKGNKRGGLW